MGVVRHEAVSVDAEPRPGGMTGEQIEIELVVRIVKEDLLATVASLRDVVQPNSAAAVSANLCERLAG